jgi:hypothetical protein
VEFRAVSPNAPLPGLEEAQCRLLALDVALKSITRKLRRLSTHSAFTRTAAELGDALKRPFLNERRRLA